MSPSKPCGLESETEIEHLYNDLSVLDAKLFEQAKKDGLNLRHIETQSSERKPRGPWSFDALPTKRRVFVLHGDRVKSRVSLRPS